ncbi:MAG: PaaI family thioesterase [Acidimicrobiia bacterium]
MPERRARDYEALRNGLSQAGSELLPGHMGLEVIELAEASARVRCELRPHHLAPNGYLHAGTVVTLADTAAGYGCVANLPEGATGFTTIEMKVNFMGTLLEGTLVAEARLIHGGRTTQVWDAEVRDEGSGKLLAAFRCTQFILYPRV